jgi:ParB family chromosome partitioning protein
MKKRALGRNLDVLLSRSKSTETKTQQHAATAANVNTGLQHLAVETLQRGRYQPRKEIAPETIQELADSIKAQGIIQPIVVRPISADKYEIIAGERRWRAAQLAGLREVPVIIKDIPDEAALAIALIENIQRENLNSIEEAIALQRLIDEFGMTHQQVASAVGKSRTTVTNLLRLLSLQSDVKTFVEQGKLEMGHARALLALDDFKQLQLARRVVEQGMSVRETEELAAKLQKLTAIPAELPKSMNNEMHQLQQKISLQLGAMVKLNHNKRGKGKMVIHYNNLKELDRILDKLVDAV